MANPFATPEMAAGYAASRPPVHRLVVERARPYLGTTRFGCAIDVGCGAGLSTAALEGFALQRLGIDPAAEMASFGMAIATGALFAAAAAEALPLRDGSVDLMAAAGSLNYVNLDRFFPEARRVLTAEGVLLVYDFSTGRAFADSTALEEWFAEFERRYPWPPGEARAIDPAFLAQYDSGFDAAGHEHFEIGLELTLPFYVDYVMTETNVAAAIRGGTAPLEIRSWCADTLPSVFRAGQREVLFRGYFAVMRKRRA